MLLQPPASSLAPTHLQNSALLIKSGQAPLCSLPHTRACGRATLPLHMSRLPSGGGGNFFDKFQNFLRTSGASGLLLPTLLLLLWSSGQFNWLFSLVNTVFLIIFIVPVIGVVGLNLWVKTSVVNGNCPSCNTPVMVAKKSQSNCMACGTPLIVEDGKVARASVYNTQQDASGRQTVVDVMDVEAIDIDAKETK